MRARILLQHLAPQKALSRIVRRATRWTWGPWKTFLINRVLRAYAVDLADAAERDPRAYASFNAFFTRALRAGARPPEGDADTWVSPADGRISQAGEIDAGSLVQAKGRTYSVAALLADTAAAEPYAAGRFATIYLSPRDYHRVHMPLDGELVETVHVPGRLFSVAPQPVAAIDGLFARNERLVCHFKGPRGPFCVVLVGAMLVSGITTTWSGTEVPPYARRVGVRDWRGHGVHLARGAELGRFEMGSTVIVLVTGASLDPRWTPETPIHVGQALGNLSAARIQVTIA
ncbi:MAG TPA: archaetidylserine decarboxylase [Rhodanobacteraceae bacterium]|nr:archaetidylserine decarboxylase [Rhodanobacteraceae bacterium]